MESLKKLYKIGPGPSSSHTMAPAFAARYFASLYPTATRFEVTLYGSLSLTGRGHLTDKIIKETFAPRPVRIFFSDRFLTRYSNGAIFRAYDKNDKLGEKTIYSLGGGDIAVKGEKRKKEDVYPEKCFQEIAAVCKKNNWDLVDYVLHYEPDIATYLETVAAAMFRCVERGLRGEGLIPGRLKLEKVAAKIYADALENKNDDDEKSKTLIAAYAYAVGEENAGGGEVVCAPTCGAAGVFAAVLYYFYHDLKRSRADIIHALMVGGVIGNVVKRNATISGARGGCQAEIGTACSMAAAGVAYLLGLDLKKIEYAAEVAMEHHLGLTCDPVLGYVQIPCIERNGVAALRAYDAALFGKYIARHRENRVSFDEVVTVMKKTGAHLRKEYKETSLGGLAKQYRSKIAPKDEDVL